jgi:hypothetical protein
LRVLPVEISRRRRGPFRSNRAGDGKRLAVDDERSAKKCAFAPAKAAHFGAKAPKVGRDGSRRPFYAFSANLLARWHPLRIGRD